MAKLKGRAMRGKKAARKPAKPAKAKVRAKAKPRARAAKPKGKAKPTRKAKARAGAAKAKPKAKAGAAKAGAAKAKAKPPAKRAAAKKPPAAAKKAPAPASMLEAPPPTTIPAGPPPAMPGATTTLVQSVDLPAPPLSVYRAFLDSTQHGAFTGTECRIDPCVGGAFTCSNGYITGETIELEEGRRIVQTWRTSEWPEGYADSVLELTLDPTSTGTKLTMVHDKVPAAQASMYESGWLEYYWEPMRRFFGGQTTQRTEI